MTVTEEQTKRRYARIVQEPLSTLMAESIGGVMYMCVPGIHPEHFARYVQMCSSILSGGLVQFGNVYINQVFPDQVSVKFEDICEWNRERA